MNIAATHPVIALASSVASETPGAPLLDSLPAVQWSSSPVHRYQVARLSDVPALVHRPGASPLYFPRQTRYLEAAPEDVSRYAGSMLARDAGCLRSAQNQ